MVIEEELKNNFGLEFKMEYVKDKTGLPRYLISGREIYRAQSDELVFYVVSLSKALDSRVLSQELASYEEIYNAPTAFWFDELAKNNRNAYVKHHIPFILPPTQIYLPFLGVLFSKKFTGQRRKDSLPLTPNAQKILFYLIYKKRSEFTKQRIAEELKIDPVYVSRGTKELVARKYVSELKKGRYTVVERDLGARELFGGCRPSLVNPVSKVIYVKRTKTVTDLPKASDYALSEMGMLNPPIIETYACYKKNQIVASFETVEEPEWEEPDKICRIELWNYDPSQLGGKDMVDRLSLYCSLMDSKDVRVQGELEGMLEGIKWQ